MRKEHLLFGAMILRKTSGKKKDSQPETSRLYGAWVFFFFYPEYDKDISFY